MIAGPMPRYGTCTRSRSAATFNCSIARWVSVPGPAEPYESLPAIRLGVLDELLQRVDRQRRRDDQHVRRAAHHRDRREILDRVVGQLAHRRIGAVRADVADHQRVAVGRGARDRERADDAAAAALVLDDDRLPERAPEPVGDRAGDEIDAAARLHRRDDLDRPVRIGGLAEAAAARPAGSTIAPMPFSTRVCSRCAWLLLGRFTDAPIRVMACTRRR